MLLHYNRSQKLRGTDWRVCEMTSADESERLDDAEIIFRRMCSSIPEIFGREAVEIFLPFDAARQLRAEIFFVRSTSAKAIGQMRFIRGLGTLSAARRSSSLRFSAVVSDKYVQWLIRKARKDHERRSAGVAVGSFVRIMDGFVREFCGTVQRIKGNMATVEVRLFSRSFTVRTPIGNLQNLSRVRIANRTFYSRMRRFTA